MNLISFLSFVMIFTLGCKFFGESDSPIVRTAAVPADKEAAEALALINLPDGFQLDVFADNVINARSLCEGENGVIFVGTRSEGKVYALIDEDGDMRSEKTVVIDQGLQSPNGVALKDGDLYVAEISRILRYRNIHDHLHDPPEPEVIYDKFPRETHHGWKYIAFGPDGMLYVPVGAPCNICLPEDEIYASITRLDVKDPKPEIVHKGIRNTVGFDWHPETGELWFTDNGADWLGDDLPACELNRATKEPLHFGYPFCHQGDLADPKLGKPGDCDRYEPPAQKLGPHVAPLGMSFYDGEQFPEKYKDYIFIAEHGSWNRSVPIGYRVSMVKMEDGQAVSYEVFADGWLQGTRKLGRPVDVIMIRYGSLLVSDDYADKVYRIHYTGKP